MSREKAKETKEKLSALEALVVERGTGSLSIPDVLSLIALIKAGIEMRSYPTTGWRIWDDKIDAFLDPAAPSRGSRG